MRDWSLPVVVLLAAENGRRHAMADLLGSAAGIQVIEAADGAAASNRLADGGIDLAWVDLHLPGLDGFAIVRSRRQEEAAQGLPATPMVAMGADAAEQDAAMGAGFSAFLTLPVTGPVLRAAVAQALPPPAIPVGLESLLPRFVSEMVADAALLEGLVNGADAGLMAHAHAMCGKAAMFGEDRLYRLLGLLEKQAIKEDMAPLLVLLAQVIERTAQLAVYERIVSAGLP